MLYRLYSFVCIILFHGIRKKRGILGRRSRRDIRIAVFDNPRIYFVSIIRRFFHWIFFLQEEMDSYPIHHNRRVVRSFAYDNVYNTIYKIIYFENPFKVSSLI